MEPFLKKLFWYTFSPKHKMFILPFLQSKIAQNIFHKHNHNYRLDAFSVTKKYQKPCTPTQVFPILLLE